MQHHYGDIKGTKGADGDPIDTFIGPNPASDKVFVVDQNHSGTNNFDEHKVMLGFDTQAEAQQAYNDNYEPGWDGLRDITETTQDEFKTWLKEGDTTKPYASPTTGENRNETTDTGRSNIPDDNNNQPSGRKPTDTRRSPADDSGQSTTASAEPAALPDDNGLESAPATAGNDRPAGTTDTGRNQSPESREPASNTNTEKLSELRIEPNTAKSFVVKGNVEKYRPALKAMHGSEQAKKGWVFSNKRREEVERFISEKLESGKTPEQLVDLWYENAQDGKNYPVGFKWLESKGVDIKKALQPFAKQYTPNSTPWHLKEFPFDEMDYIGNRSSTGRIDTHLYLDYYKSKADEVLDKAFDADDPILLGSNPIVDLFKRDFNNVKDAGANTHLIMRQQKRLEIKNKTRINDSSAPEKRALLDFFKERKNLPAWLSSTWDLFHNNAEFMDPKERFDLIERITIPGTNGEVYLPAVKEVIAELETELTAKKSQAQNSQSQPATKADKVKQVKMLATLLKRAGVRNTKKNREAITAVLQSPDLPDSEAYALYWATIEAMPRRADAETRQAYIDATAKLIGENFANMTRHLPRDASYFIDEPIDNYQSSDKAGWQSFIDRIPQIVENTTTTPTPESVNEPNSLETANSDGVSDDTTGRGRPNQSGDEQADNPDLDTTESSASSTTQNAGDSDTGSDRDAGENVERAGRPDRRGDASDGREGDSRAQSSDAAAGDSRANRVTDKDLDSPAAAKNTRDFVITDPTTLVGGTPIQRFNKNTAAIELRNTLLDEGRAPTEEEKAILAGYTGWGSFGQELFQGSWKHPQPKQGWEKRDAWLREHLGESEWNGVRDSIINAHYTDPYTIQTIWNMLDNMGFQGGRVLEPSMGTGNFFGLMPEKMRNRSMRAGIELDPLTGSIAQMLYPEANIQIKGYEKSKTPDNFYDVVVGNWPFADFSPADRRYNKLSPSLHDYFFLKALDQTRPGGLVVGITSRGTMDKVKPQVRSEMARKAELVDAYRLPMGAFKEFAGTNVVTDLIVLRKRDEPITLLND